MQVRHAREILPDQRVLALVADVHERGLEPAARVVDEHVDAVERRDPVAHRVGVADVEQLGVRVPARAGDLTGGARQPVGVSIADRDVGAEAGERDRDRRADALRRAGHDRATAGEEHGVGRDRHRARRLASRS